MYSFTFKSYTIIKELLLYNDQLYFKIQFKILIELKSKESTCGYRLFIC